MRPHRGLSAVIAAVLALAAPSSAAAAISCQDSTINNQFDGFPSADQVYGVYGFLRDRAINLCTTASDDDSGASAWLMLTGGGPYEYAQIGYWRSDSMPSPLIFVEFNTGDPDYVWQRITFSSPVFSPGTSRDYTVAYSTTDHFIHFYVVTSHKYATPWSATAKWTYPWGSQFMGETWDRGDDVAGTATLKTNFSGLRTQKCTGCSYTAPYDENLISTYGPYKNQWVSRPQSFNVWTAR